MAIDKGVKSLAISILKEKGIDYEEWLNDEHKKIIFGNTEFLQSAIEGRKKNN